MNCANNSDLMLWTPPTLSKCFQGFHPFAPSTHKLLFKFFSLHFLQTICLPYTRSTPNTHVPNTYYRRTWFQKHISAQPTALHTHTFIHTETRVFMFACLRQGCSLSSCLMFHQQDSTLLFKHETAQMFRCFVNTVKSSGVAPRRQTVHTVHFYDEEMKWTMNEPIMWS